MGTGPHRLKIRQCALAKFGPHRRSTNCYVPRRRPGQVFRTEKAPLANSSHLTEHSMAVQQQASNTAFCRRASKKPGTSRVSASFTYVVRLGWCSLALLLLAECTGAAARPLTAGSQSGHVADHSGKLTAGLQQQGDRAAIYLQLVMHIDR